MTDPGIRYVRVAFPIPVNESYWYLNDEAAPALAGFRVKAELGRRSLVGFAVETAADCPLPLSILKPIGRRVDDEAIFGEQTLKLAEWVSKMYFCSLGEALGTMLPAGKKESEVPSAVFGDFRIGDRPHGLTDEQEKALGEIISRPDGTTYIYGPTGTGKTEVFLQAAERVLAEGKSVLYLVPEIALTGQVERAARLRFGDGCAVLHSRLTPSGKLSEWRRILRGEARMVIGARSAIFAPLRDCGLIIIDEEHEASYKSGSAPRYHARQAAMHLAASLPARLVLGSATPSVEAWDACSKGGMRMGSLSRRPGGGDFPSVEIVDMRRESSTISAALADAMRATKEEGRQTILFLNRRGFSHFYSCNTCGAELTCRNCSVALTYHKASNQLVCHYCGYRAPPPEACPECGSLDTGWRGFGTERVEEELREIFPDWKIGRLDTDTARKKGALESALEEFRSGRLDVLVGTQMVAKGLNFPGVKTVGVVLADAGLNVPDFRAAERVFSLLVQVAGRAGRYDSDGKVYIQTLRPDHPVIRLAAGLDMESFYARELMMREVQGFPPFGRLARVVARSKSKPQALRAIRDLAGRCAETKPPGVEMLGPVECALGLVAGSVRWQILLRCASPAPLHRTLRAMLDGYAAPSACYLEIDMDPVNLL